MIEKMATLLPVDDIGAGVALWSSLLGNAPTFVDAGRWAQFDTAGGRIALATGGEKDLGLAVMFKVADLDAMRRQLEDAGLVPGSIETGHHEQRFTVAAGAVSVIYYQVASPGSERAVAGTGGQAQQGDDGC